MIGNYVLYTCFGDSARSHKVVSPNLTACRVCVAFFLFFFCLLLSTLARFVLHAFARLVLEFGIHTMPNPGTVFGLRVYVYVCVCARVCTYLCVRVYVSWRAKGMVAFTFLAAFDSRPMLWMGTTPRPSHPSLHPQAT